MSSTRTAIVVSDSNLGEQVIARLKSLGFNVLDVQEWRASKRPLSVLIFCTEAAMNEPRKPISSLDDFRDQWTRLMDKETKLAFELCSDAFVHLKEGFKACGAPSSIVFLGSKVVRSPNSPQQVVSSVVKRSVLAFAGSVFFEKRGEGIRLSCINPSPGIPKETLVDSLVFPVTVGPTACIEAIDLTPLKSSAITNVAKKWGGAFVTGASRGIGRDIAVRIAKEFRMPIALLGRDEEQLKIVAAECAQYIGESQVVTFAFDVLETEKLKTAISSFGTRFGGISCLVCSAGINRRASSVSADGLKFADPKVWHNLIDINFSSSMYCTQYALPFMVKRPEGPSIFYIGSRTIRVGGGAPGQQAYVASKMAIAGFAASVQQEVKDLGVRVVTLNVGLVATELGNKTPKVKNFTPAPPETQIQPKDISDAVVFTLNMDPRVSPSAFDICGMHEEYLSNEGKALKFSNL